MLPLFFQFGMMEIGSDQVRESGIVAIEKFNMMEKVSWKGTDLGSLKKALNVLKFFSTSYKKQVGLCCLDGLGENFAFRNHANMNVSK